MATLNPFRRSKVFVDQRSRPDNTGAPANAQAPELRAQIPVTDVVAASVFGSESSIVSQSSPTMLSPPTSPPTSTPKRIPPPVLPRVKRRSCVEPQPSPTLSVDPFNSTPDPSSESESESVAEHKDILPSPINPFHRSQLGSNIQRSPDTAETAFTGFPNVENNGSGGGIPTPKPGRQSLNVDAFKKLMLTGQIPTSPASSSSTTPPATVVGDSNSTDTSSVSRQSIFEPIPEGTAGVPTVDSETPRTSHEIGDEERIQFVETGSRERPISGGHRPKPPPPKPRSRSGGKASVSVSSTPPLSTTPQPPPSDPKRPISINTGNLDQLFPPQPAFSSPGVVQEPLSTPSPMLQPMPFPIAKKIAPSPPLSRKHSTKSSTNPRTLSASTRSPSSSSIVELQRPSTPGGGKPKAPPPPPPIRRQKSTASRPLSMTVQDKPQLQGPGSLILPPPPPPPRKRSSTVNSRTSTDDGPAEDILKPSPSASLKVESVENVSQVTDVDLGGDILVDLEKLQREVDELRRSYEERANVVG